MALIKICVSPSFLLGFRHRHRQSEQPGCSFMAESCKDVSLGRIKHRRTHIQAIKSWGNSRKLCSTCFEGKGNDEMRERKESRRKSSSANYPPPCSSMFPNRKIFTYAFSTRGKKFRLFLFGMIMKCLNGDGRSL